MHKWTNTVEAPSELRWQIGGMLPVKREVDSSDEERCQLDKRSKLSSSPQVGFSLFSLCSSYFTAMFVFDPHLYLSIYVSHLFDQLVTRIHDLGYNRSNSSSLCASCLYALNLTTLGVYHASLTLVMLIGFVCYISSYVGKFESNPYKIKK